MKKYKIYYIYYFLIQSFGKYFFQQFFFFVSQYQKYAIQPELSSPAQEKEKNKDNYRMMVDPMFMIVQSLRLFLTAVTLTDVAPIAVISPVFT